MEKIQSTMTKKEVSKELNISEQTVDNWIKEGKLRSFRDGKFLKIYTCDVVKLSVLNKKVQNQKEVLKSCEIVKSEFDEILHDKLVLVHYIMKTAIEENKELSTLGGEKCDEDFLKILLDNRKYIESFYTTIDTIRCLDQVRKYKKANKTTIDEELYRLNKTINNEELNNEFKGISTYELFKDI